MAVEAFDRLRAANGGSLGGFSDVFAWREPGEVRFYEAKVGPDRIKPTQLRFAELALRFHRLDAETGPDEPETREILRDVAAAIAAGRLATEITDVQGEAAYCAPTVPGLASAGGAAGTGDDGAMTVPLAEQARAAIAALGLPEAASGRALRRIAEIEAALQMGASPEEARDALTQVVVQSGGGDPWRQP
jgi:hypothetical protein